MGGTEIELGLRLRLFPDTAAISHQAGRSQLSIAGCDLSTLAEQFGTPLYIYDQVTLDRAVQTYRDALQRFYPGKSGLTYAGKAYLCTAIAQWAHRSGLVLDCTGAGELRVAAEAQSPRAQILVHGVNKSAEDLQASLEQAGILVIDNLSELERLVTLRQGIAGQIPNLWLRLRPGLAVKTHRHTQTGQEDSKFGMSLPEARLAAQICLNEGLPLTGLHFHQGSHFHEPDPIGPAVVAALDLFTLLYAETGWQPEALCTGGGWGVAYHETELPHPALEEYVSFVCRQIVAGCESRQLPLPRLVLEPGRSLVARAGVALYRVGTMKQTANRRWLLLDGGLSDNPRPALYQTRYSALPVSAPDRPSAGPAWMGGPHCESGDILIEGLPMPDVQPGELVAVPVSGAYQLSMGSNYNGARKPAVVLLEMGKARLIQRRETLDDLVRRDILI